MADQTQKTTHSVMGDVKSALKGAKGAGDAIRGTFNESVDTAFNMREGEVANRAIKEKGIADMERTDQHFNQPHAPGTNAAGTHPGISTGGVTGTNGTAAGTTTGAGAHSGSVGNMDSGVPQSGLSSDPAPTRERY